MLFRSTLSLLPYPCVHKSVLYVCFSIAALKIISAIFLDSIYMHSDQFSSVSQSCPTLFDPMNRSAPVHDQLPEFTQTHVHRVDDSIQPPHPLSSPSPPAPNPSQHQYVIFIFLCLISLYIIGSRFVHLIRTDSNVFLFVAE